VLDPALFLGLALLAGGLACVSPAQTVLAVAATLLFARRRARGVLLAAAVGAVSYSFVRAGRAVAQFDRSRAEVREAIGGPSRCAARATVQSSPVMFRSAARSPPGPSSLVPSFDADLTEVECEGRLLGRSFRARIYGGPDDLARGDEIELVATLAPVQLFRNEDLPDPRPGATRRGVLASGGAEGVRVTRRAWGLLAAIDHVRARSRRRIEATFAPEAAPMARALVIGESDLDERDNQAFRASGLAHLLAVSGTHLVLVVAGAVRALIAILRRFTWASERWDVGRLGAACGAGFAWVYADFAGGSGSAIRAAAMLSVALAARALGRASDGPRAFGLSIVGASVVDPLVAFDLSFMLSVAATGGLMVLQRPIASRLAPAPVVSLSAPTAYRRAWRAVAGALATTVSATIGCAPLIAFIAPALPVGGVLANLLAVPVGELVALPLCLGHTLLSSVPLLERGDALVASGSLLVVRAIARATERATWLALPVPPPSAWQSALLWATSAALFFEARRRVAVAIVALLVLGGSEWLIRRQAAPRAELRVTVLDVGQGDASIVDLPDGRAMLVDGGGLVGSPVDVGKAIVAPTLRARRRSSLAVVVLTHPHPDHFGGLSSALADVDVGEFWDTGQGEREGAAPAYAALLAGLRARGVPIVRPSSLCGRPRSFAGAKVEVLAPCPEPIAFANPNDNSFVIRVTFGHRAALLVGDAERSEEEELVRSAPSALRADFLKVGHHGSATSSTPAFVAAVGAEDAAISCGVRNRFGHPHPVTLRTLSASCRIHRTDRGGSVRWETDGITQALFEATEGDRF
jgi:competence protein ComEC